MCMKVFWHVSFEVIFKHVKLRSGVVNNAGQLIVHCHFKCLFQSV